MAYALNPRDYFAAALPHVDVPGWFVHTPPVNPPMPPAYPDGYTAPEQAEITAWRPNKDDTQLTLAGSIAYGALFRSYMAANQAWVASNNLARVAQYRLALADAHIGNYSTVPGGLSPTATPVSAPATTTVRIATTPPGFPSGGGGLVGFTDTYDMGSGNEIIPNGASSVTINVWGGGGGGGGGGATPYGGASGGFSTRIVAIAAGDYGLSIAYVVGAAGVGGVTSGGNAGNSSVGAFTVVAGGPFTLVANGGTGSVSSTNGGTGGTASGGTTNTSGSSGTIGSGANAPGGGGTGGGYASPGTSPGAGGGAGNHVNSDRGGNGASGRVQFIWS